MSIGPRLIIQGTMLGSLIVTAFGLFVTAHAAPLVQEPAPAAVVAEAPQPAAEAAPAEEQAVSDEGGVCEVSDRFPQSILQWCGLITRYAQERDLEANLVASVMLQESGGKPEAYSRSGAVGLLQVMPRDGISASFMCVNGPCFASRPTIDELKNPEFNIEYGTGMLASLVSRHGNVRDALMAYGPMDVGYYYADKVLAIYNSYAQ
ncbi:MAG: hypothetical protein EHM70_00360 [Chloroflexota bacterium]|nr:MAG: hypothetical protein EHM70_00360 [Chloroflexota bacterium]